MKYLSEYRNPGLVSALSDQIRATAHHAWTLMEICGGQTHTILKYGLTALLPESLELIHGPGCPVCVTPVETLDAAISLSAEPSITLCTFGDMLRVPGSRSTLADSRARGGDIRVVYSPFDCIRLASERPCRQIVFLAVGFETTAPVHATAIMQAKRLGIRNLSFLVSISRVPPAMDMILGSQDTSVQALVAAGHVCSVMGLSEYEELAARFRVPVVATGFEPADILQGVLMAIRQLEDGTYKVENQYARAVRWEGNPVAKAAVSEVFEIGDRTWRGLGTIPLSGFRIRSGYSDLDAESRFRPASICTGTPGQCRAGDVLRGVLRPPDCPDFGVNCTPTTPRGAPMVSAEGACAAYFCYGQRA